MHPSLAHRDAVRGPSTQHCEEADADEAIQQKFFRIATPLRRQR
jgi:hypothetical protein